MLRGKKGWQDGQVLPREEVVFRMTITVISLKIILYYANDTE
jgi:hypothetical protein